MLHAMLLVASIATPLRGAQTLVLPDGCALPSSDESSGEDGELRRTYRTLAPAVRAACALDPELVHVEWSAPRVHIDRWSRWQRTRIEIGGRIRSSEQGEDVGWFQGVSLLVARHPGERLDWSRPEDRARAAFAPEALACPHGWFAFDVPASAIERAIGHDGRFEVALLLATHAESEVRWALDDPLLVASAAALTISGCRPLSELQTIVNAVLTPEPEHHDPLALLRCARRLHALGKDGALAVLRDWAGRADHHTREHGPTWEQTRPESIDASDVRVIPLIAAALFVPSEDEPLPPLSDPRSATSRTLAEQAAWPRFPYHEHEGIPLVLPHRDAMSGGFTLESGPSDPDREHVRRFLDWCAEHAELRADVPTPPDDPFAALDRWLADPLVRGYLERLAHEAHLPVRRRESLGRLRAQVLRLARSVLPAEELERAISASARSDPDEPWTAWRKNVGPRVRWDASIDDYRASE